MDRMTLMRTFVAVGDEGSFSRAARRLDISVSLVSRHVAELERSLESRLVNRSARAVSLTEAGARHLSFARRILHEIDLEDADLRRSRTREDGPLAVICPRWIGNLDLAEAVADFSVSHPDIVVTFEVGGMTEQNSDFLNRGYDVAFHTYDLRDSTLLIRKVADLPFVLCASPGYLSANAHLSVPTQIVEHDCIVHLKEPVWTLTGANGELFEVRQTSAVYQSNSHLTLLKAAVRGRGLALLPLRTAITDLDSGNLTRVLPGYHAPAHSLYAIHSPGTHSLRRVVLFLDYVTAWFAGNPLLTSDPRRKSARMDAGAAASAGVAADNSIRRGQP